MDTPDPTTPTASRPARAFAVRVWKEELAGGSGYRGTVRDVLTDGYRGFRDWSDLVAFIVARVEQTDDPRR